jgi:hypothetical protein
MKKFLRKTIYVILRTKQNFPRKQNNALSNSKFSEEENVQINLCSKYQELVSNKDEML